MRVRKPILVVVPLFALFLSVHSEAQSVGSIRGSVFLKERDVVMHNASILLVSSGRRVETDENGAYRFDDLPAGTYEVVASSPGLAAEIQSVYVSPGEAVVADFILSLSPIREEITVTASGRPQTTFESFQTVTSLDAFDLAQQASGALGDVLDNQPGVTKRSFGPGNSRPVVRGFDGDRVLVLQDGVRTGSLAAQSGDHGEPIDVLSLERLEVVKGPATLLYGSNAIGGVVNAVSGHHELHLHPHQGVTGYLSGVTGSGNATVGGSAGFEFGWGNWLTWGNGGGQRSGDYETPEGVIPNSGSRVGNGTGGLSYAGERGFFSVSYGYDEGFYDIPFAAEFEAESEGGEDPGAGEETISIDYGRQNLRFSGGVQNTGHFIDTVTVSLNYSDWHHEELEFFPGGSEVGTVFDNGQFVYRATFDQRQTGPLTGTLGVWGTVRDYDVVGAEALSPPVDQKGFAVFGLEELDFENFRLQFGGRVEHTSYAPESLQTRSFTGVSGAAGIRVPLWAGGAFVANYTRSFRAPALDELYNNGPHVGNLTYEIGNGDLQSEQSDGIDLSLRHERSRVSAEINMYAYRISDFVFLGPTGVINEGLIEARYSQADSLYSGMEGAVNVGVTPYLWVNTGVDLVRAALTATGTPLPRIPPLRGRFGVDARFGGLSIKPEVVVAKDQDRLFSTETRTPGYTLMNLTASYTLPRQHTSHQIALNVFNIGNRLYRNHLSFIKDLAPEIGRGARLTYTMKFF